MALTRGDDYPIHQTPEPIAYSGTDRNFYDRYFFNGYGAEGELFFAAAFGVYPHLNIADAAFCVVRDGVQTSLHASRWLMMAWASAMMRSISCFTVGTSWIRPATMPQDQAPASIAPSVMILG